MPFCLETRARRVSISRERETVRVKAKPSLLRKKKRMRAANSLLHRSSSIPSFSFLLVLFVCFLVPTALADCSEYDHSHMATPGGVRDSQAAQNSADIEGLARFAVDEHNKKENALLEFAKVVKAQEQVVAGTLHHLTLEAIDAGKRKIYEAKIWVKPWMNFKELQEFKHAGDVPEFTSADLGVKKDGHKPGWHTVPAHDPQVQDAANHAVKAIQQRSNSLLPYELHEVVDAKAEVIDDSAKFNLLLKVKRGDKEEKFNVEVHKNNQGGFHLNQMESDHS